MITAAIPTYNEGKNIRGCIESIISIKSITEIFIIDSFSTDETIKLANDYVLTLNPPMRLNVISKNLNITGKRKLALSESANDWILFIDADERVTSELQNEINALAFNDDVTGYNINRRNFYFGKWIKHCGIYPDHHLRLFNKNKARITERVIHEGVVVTGKTVTLQNDLLHYSVNDMGQMIDKINFYSTYEAQEHFNNKKQISKFGVFTHALSAFLRVFISRKGYKDGLPGFYVSVMDSVVNFMTHLKLLTLRAKQSNL